MTLPRISIKRLVIPLFLGLAGFIGNWFNLPLFFDVDFLFGSFFVMLAVFWCGIPGALTAGFIAASCSYLLWDHPWAIVTFTSEALFVALGHRRRPGNLVLLDACFWLCLGIPQVWIFYRLVMGMSLQAMLLIALKQSVNGIFNALLASLFMYAVHFVKPSRNGEKRLIPFRQFVSIGVVALIIFPSFFDMVLDLKHTIRGEEESTHNSVLRTSEISRNILNSWVSKNLQDVVALSHMVGDPATASFSSMQGKAEMLKQADPEFLWIGVADKDAVSVAFAPLVDEMGASTLGVDFSDRSYVPLMQQTLKPVVPDLLVGRVGVIAPRLPLVAPIVVNNQYKGYCFGVVDFTKIPEQIGTLAKDHAMTITLLDRNGKVIVSTSNALQAMQKFSRPDGGTVRKFPDGSYQWVPKPEKGASIMGRWRKSLLVKEALLSPEVPWTVIVESPMAPFFNTLSRKTIEEFLMMLGVALLTIVIAEFFSKRFVASLAQLETVTAGLPNNLSDAGLQWPESNIKELHSLIINSRSMAGTLNDYIQKLVSMHEELEQLVDERTQALQESEKRYRQQFQELSQIYAYTPAGIFAVDKDLRYLRINERLAEINGKSVEEHLGRTVDEVLPADLAGYLKKIWQSVLERGECVDNIEVQAALPRFPALRRNFLTSYYPLRSDDGVVVGLMGSVLDITERKRAEERLAQSEAYYRAMIDAFDGLMYICSPDYRIEFMNNRLKERTGYDGTGHLCHEVLHELDSICAWCVNDRVFAGESVQWEVQSPKDDRWYHVSNSPIYNANGTISKQAMIIDITERKIAEKALQESEERYSRIVNTANEGIWLVDKDYIITYVNSNMAEMLGYLPEEIIGRPFERFIADDDLPDHALRVQNRKQGKAERYERRLLCKDGSWALVQMSSTPIMDADNRFLASFAMCTDITQRKLVEIEILNLNRELEQRVFERTAELEHSNKDLENFCYSISHELRAPIARLEGFSKMLAESVADADTNNLAHYAHRIISSSQRLRTVIDSLLMINRISRADIASEWVDLSELARQIADELLEGTDQRTLKVSIVPKVFARGDNHMLRICMQNLIGNAFKFTAKNPEAEIEFGVTFQSGKKVYFVKDNGAGFDTAFINKLFQPFSRLHSDTEFEGNGIGLATVHRIIERHGGSIWADAAPGKGATFFFTIGQ